MFCLAALQRRPVRCHSGWVLNVLRLSGHLGQLAPTTLPQRRLVSNLSLCGSLSHYPFALRASLSLCFVLFTHPRGFVLLLTLPTGFSLSLSSLCLYLVLPPPLLAGSTQAYPPSRGITGGGAVTK